MNIKRRRRKMEARGRRWGREGTYSHFPFFSVYLSVSRESASEILKLCQKERAMVKWLVQSFYSVCFTGFFFWICVLFLKKKKLGDKKRYMFDKRLLFMETLTVGERGEWIVDWTKDVWQTKQTDRLDRRMMQKLTFFFFFWARLQLSCFSVDWIQL